jgi:hypothetical protein
VGYGDIFTKRACLYFDRARVRGGIARIGYPRNDRIQSLCLGNYSLGDCHPNAEDIFTKKKLKKGLQKSQKDNKRNISENVLINIQESLVISLSGMRGIVSLAIALALPETLENNSPFPMRAEILFITFMVILYSVVGQGMLLPIILKKITPRRYKVQRIKQSRI